MALAVRTRRLGAALLATPLLAAPALVAGTATADSSVRGQATGAVKATATNKFEPPTINVAVGATVTWTNENGFHTVTGGTPGQEDPSGPKGTLSSAGQTYQFTFTKAGTFKYFCQPHASVGMTGEVVVGGASGGGASPSPAGPTVTPTAEDPESTASPAATTEPGQGSQASPSERAEPDEVPGLGKDNEVLQEIATEEAAKKRQIGGFNTLLAGIVAATLALAVAVFASTRPRRGAR